MPSPDAAAELRAILDDVRAWVCHRREEGEREVEAAAPSPDASRPAGSEPVAPSVEDRLAAVAAEVAACERCELHRTRTHTVPGAGSPHPDIVFVGEGPGEEEDRQGVPFVGAAGELLTLMIAAMGYTRETAFIANIVKCRPPGNRKPTPGEMEACLPYLRAQIETLKPRVVVALGATATQGLLRTDTGISRLRGRWCQYQGIPVMPTYHPAFLLRTPSAKRDSWKDLQAVLARLGRTPPSSAPAQKV
jgi:DNA polymerase